MKKIISLFFTLVSLNSFAEVFVHDNGVQEFRPSRDCPRCRVLPITITTFKFTYFSCRRFHKSDFNVHINDRVLGHKSVKTVEISLDKLMMDCRALPKAHTYQLSTAQIKRGESYIILNSTLVNK